ncbi:hypothetical protein CASFOL_014251 [Castilleja foliolosa]|uniref:Ubiquitin-like protease family profile domain-containing protein n=1 Tax=Castilleja foliolosa TaxID=1961234 RepID=A0ABD3DRE4_9LAMI
MASADNTVNNNNMEIQVYQPPQVGESVAAANPTNAADSTPTNTADSCTTISDNNNADSTTGWKWMWPNLRIAERKRSSLLLDVKKELPTEFSKGLGSQMFQRFRERCFGAYLQYPKTQVPSAVMHLMLSQQVIKEGAEEDELWFLVGDKFVRFSKYEYALVTGLRFETTNFDPNAISRCPKKEVFRKFIDPENKYGKKARRTMMFWICLKNHLRLSEDHLKNYTRLPRYHFIFEAVPGLAANITSKPKHKLVQPRIMKRLVHIKTKDNILEFFDTKEPIECYGTLEPTKKELVDYTWWNHVADDLRSSVKYIHRESKFKAGKAKDTALKMTREQSPVPAREQEDGSVPAVEDLRQRTRARMTESPNVDPNVLFTKILEGVRRENELLVQRLLREMREIEERASRKSDDMRSEIDRLRKTVYVPFDDNFCDEIGAFMDMVDYVRHRQVGEPPSTLIDKRFYVQNCEPLTPIRITKAELFKHQDEGKDSEFKIRRAIRPTKDSDGTSFFFPDRNNKQMTAYLDYLYSDSKKLRDIGNTVPEIASFFKEIENPTRWMETPAIEAYLRILKFNPEFLGCHPEGKGKYTILGHFFCEPTIIPEEVKGQAEKLDSDEEQVEILLNLDQGKTKLYLTDKWASLVPFTEVEKIYVVWLASQHFYPLIIDLVKCEVWIFDSLSKSTNRTQRENRYQNTLSLRRILPSILMLLGFYDMRKDLKPLNREWDLRFRDKNYCFTQADGLSCGPFSLKMIEVFVSRRALPNITEENMKFIRRGISERIFSFSKPEKDSTK